MLRVRLDETRLRPLATAALTAYDEVDRASGFLLTATPGAGKTTFALAVAGRLLARRVIDRVVVVCPTDHLRTQWADAAGAVGLVLDPTMTNAQGPVPSGADGYVTTYAQVAGRPAIHAARCRRLRTLVVLDEIHHAGDGLSWGEATAEAFGDVHRRLCLTGTPFRTRPGERIPFVSYETDGDLLRSVADFTYGYREALADGVVRPVVFAAYTGVSRWRNSAGEVIAASLTDAGTKSVEAAAWKTALDPSGGWVPHVIAAMDERITHLREIGMTDAAGIVLASDQDDARAYAKVVRKITGESTGADPVRRPGRVEADRGVPHLRPADRGLRPDDLRGRRHPAGRLPGLDDQLPDAAVLRPGRRAGGARQGGGRVGDGVPARGAAAGRAGRRARTRPQPRDGTAAARRRRATSTRSTCRHPPSATWYRPWSRWTRRPSSPT